MPSEKAVATCIIREPPIVHTLYTCKSLSSIEQWSIVYEMHSLPLFTFFRRQEIRDFQPMKEIAYHIA